MASQREKGTSHGTASFGLQQRIYTGRREMAETAASGGWGREAWGPELLSSCVLTGTVDE